MTLDQSIIAANKSVYQFMKKNIDGVREIIDKLDNTFNTHFFIKKFAEKYEVDYVSLLSLYTKEPFKTVHAQIGRLLAEYAETLQIEKDEVVRTDNIFGTKSENQQWNKV